MDEAPRRLARERVLTLLYEADVKDITIGEILGDLPVPPEPFVIELVTGVDSSSGALDVSIARHATNWDVDRMPALDRAILRIGAWELVNRPDLPVAVVISEAVELAKRFSTDESGRFVNGVLSALATEIRDN